MDRARAYLVDDEPRATQRLARMLEETHHFEVVGSATDPRVALEFLTRSPPAVDVVFVDIEMPSMTGLELASLLPPGPMIVFVTAYDAFALQAFEVNAIDYLVKPVRASDIERVVAKLARFRATKAAPSGGAGEPMLALLARVERALEAARPVDRIASRLGDRIHFVELARVTHFQAEDKLTCAVTAERSYVVDASIADLEIKLASARFFRIHRATLVNLAFVAELQPAAAGGALVRLSDSAIHLKELQVACDRVRALKEHLSI